MFNISMSSRNINVIGSRSRSNEKIIYSSYIFIVCPVFDYMFLKTSLRYKPTQYFNIAIACIPSDLNNVQK